MAIPSNFSAAQIPGRAGALAAKIHGHRLGRDFRLVVTQARAVRPRSGWLHLSVALADTGNAISAGPFMTAIVSGGGRGVQPWIECRIFPQVQCEADRFLDARALGLEAGLIGLLGALVPPGGHLMIDYESGGQELTLSELVLQVPPPACYLGDLMFRAGCRGHFKDWYFSEGGHEGPRKLQANKSPTAKAAQAALRDNLTSLKQFVRRRLPQEESRRAVIHNAVARARKLIKDFARPVRR